MDKTQTTGPITPVLRMFDPEKARAFYVNFRVFAVDWEHRFEPGLPLYMQASRGDAVIHLSEHHGDASPGSAIRIRAGDIDALHAEFSAKEYGFARPHVELMPWGLREITMTDPFGNRVIFYEEKAV
jgi:hypothetical protein